MHSAIIVIKMPEPSHNEVVSAKWQKFIAEIDALVRQRPDPLDQQQGVARLAENVWMVNLQHNPPALAKLVHFSTQFGFAYGILPLDASPQWLPVGFDPKTTLAQNDE